MYIYIYIIMMMIIMMIITGDFQSVDVLPSGRGELSGFWIQQVIQHGSMTLKHNARL